MDLVHGLARLELDTGKHIRVNLEPEPGCVLERAADVVTFFERYLWGGPDERSVREYLGVCHDVCHSAVMFEEQSEALQIYRDAELRVGKVQLSSALQIDGERLSDRERRSALYELRAFSEDRYLHQTSVRDDGGEVTLYRDLPEALAVTERSGRGLRGEWRVHFHVPIFAPTWGVLGTTRSEIGRCLDALRPTDGVMHYEVETYAWDVLPAKPLGEILADGIAQELSWVCGRGWKP